MAGHSKWANIKRKKGVEDARRGALFTKFARDIKVAVQKGGKDPSVNFALRLAIEKAKAGNMPKRNIERIVTGVVGEKNKGNVLVDAIYEGYGPSGVAFLIKCLTNNKNRTVSEVRNVFRKSGGSLSEVGSVAYIFDASFKPSFTVPLDEQDIQKFKYLLNELESLNDTVKVFHNAQL